MRVWKQWTDEHGTNRKTGSGRLKATSMSDDRHLLRMAMNERTSSSRQLAARWSTAKGVLMSASSIRRRLLPVDCLQGCLYTEFPSRQTIYGCVCNGS
ncbi:transposable element Tcb2 transposase [Trichonephila clavipes]|nr:transposable element Tcb2 transposase [Trichonephila clavipes]